MSETETDLQSKFPKCPPPGTWLRDKETGDLAQVVVHEDTWKIKPDKPGSPVYYPATQAHRFNIETKPRKMPPGSFARVAYEANKALCDIHSDLKKCGKEWMSLNPTDRAKWIEGRVKFDNVLQLELHNAIIKVLESSGE